MGTAGGWQEVPGLVEPNGVERKGTEAGELAPSWFELAKTQAFQSESLWMY